MWPGVSKLVNWHEYPQWSPQCLSKAVPNNLDKDGLHLLSVKTIDIQYFIFCRRVVLFTILLPLKEEKKPFAIAQNRLKNTSFIAGNAAVRTLKAYLSKEGHGAPLF